MASQKITFNRALVTGATSGIGGALCELLAAKGISLMLTGRNTEKLQALIQKFQGQVSVSTYPLDLKNSEQRKVLIQQIHAQAPDLIINNAGFGLYGPALMHETQAQMDLLEVNGNAVLELTLEAGRTLVTKGNEGVIVNISSAAAFYSYPSLAVYAASKAFVNSFSEALDDEWRAKGVRVLTACPGMVATAFRKRASGSSKEHSTPFDMTASFAAEEIWRQIQKGKQVHVFDWRYRLSCFARHLIPRKWLKRKLQAAIDSRHILNRIIPIE